jgi:hypothetical protein
MAMGWRGSRSGQIGRLHGRQLLYLHGVGNRSPCTSVVVLVPCAVAHAPVGVEGRSCEAETCRGDPSCRELVGDVANLSETGRLASVGIDRGPQSSSS